MKTRDLKLTRIGNSRGVRLPAGTLRRYGFGDVVVMEERVDGILLRPKTVEGSLLSWEETAREMATHPETWSEWDGTTGDGLDALPWRPSLPAVAEPRPPYGSPPERGDCQGRRRRAP